jgi:hypothetical protein
MADDQKLRSQVDRGEVARGVLAELEKAFKALEEDCFATFKASDVHDDAGRRTCRLYLKVLDDVRTRFAVAVRTGEAAHKELIRIKEPSKLRKAIGL